MDTTILDSGVATEPGLRLGFVLLSSLDRPIPSTRVAVLNMLPFLSQLGHECHVLHAPANPTETPELGPNLIVHAQELGLDLVVFQKVRGPSVLSLVWGLRAVGVGSCFMFCDVIDPEMVQMTDGSIVVTEYLRSLHEPRLQRKMHVVHDGIERPEAVRVGRSAGHGDTLRAVLVTSAQLWHVPVMGFPPPWMELSVVGRYADSPGTRWREAIWAMRRADGPEPPTRLLPFLMHPRVRCVQWTEQGVYDELRRADIGVIPVDAAPWDRGDPASTPDWARKSENRLTLKMAMGLPVVASRVPSYEAVAEDGVNCLLADTREDWMRALSALRHPGLRQRMGAAARAAVLPRFSMDQQALALDRALRSIAGTRVKSLANRLTRS